jgi:hypothetical protein
MFAAVFNLDACRLVALGHGLSTHLSGRRDEIRATFCAALRRADATVVEEKEIPRADGHGPRPD